jgi:hypothetical protein
MPKCIVFHYPNLFGRYFIVRVKYMEPSDNIALSPISIAELIAGYPIPVAMFKALCPGLISASTINFSLTICDLFLLISIQICQSITR